MAKIEQRIQISRSAYIEASRLAAELRLKRKEFLKGEVVMLNYYKDQDYRTNIGVMVAIGVKDGVGEDCYRFLSIGGQVQVAGVVDLPPDVSSLVHGEVYVYQATDRTWYYVYLNQNGIDRQFKKIPNGNFIFLDVNSGYRWFYNNQNCRREDDFYSTGGIIELLEAIQNTDIEVKCESDVTLVDPLSPGGNINITVSARKIRGGENVTSRCKFYYNGNEINPASFSIPAPSRDTRIYVDAVYNVEGVDVRYEGFLDIFVGFGIYYTYLNPGEESIIIPNCTRKLVKRGGNIKLDNINLAFQKLAVLYPRTFGPVKYIYDDNRIEYIQDYAGREYNQEIEGNQYYLYILKDPIVVEGFLQDFRFSEVTEGGGSGIGAEYGDLTDLIAAWKNQGIEGGLVVLNDFGKIDESLYSQNIASSFVPIKDFTDGVLSSGLEEGCLYYDETGKTLYKAISSTDILIIDPLEESVIYTWDDRFYYWDIDEGSLVIFSSNISSNKINDITEIL